MAKAIFGYEYQFSPMDLKQLLKANGLKIIDFTSPSFNRYSYFDRLLRKLRLAKLKIYLVQGSGILHKNSMTRVKLEYYGNIETKIRFLCWKLIIT